MRFTTCTLCPAGCAMRARGVGDAVVSLAALARRRAVPDRGGGASPALSPVAGAAGHARGAAIAHEAAAEEIRQVMKSGPVAVLDLRPGRTASLVYRRFAAGAGGLYVRSAPASLSAPWTWPKRNTLISFGAPVLDGWGTPGRVLRGRPAPDPDRTGRVAHRGDRRSVDARKTRDGSGAGARAGPRPGRRFRPRIHPRAVAKVTGVAAETIAETARAIAKAGGGHRGRRSRRRAACAPPPKTPSRG